MTNEQLMAQIKAYEENYKLFMGIEEFPTYDLETRVISLDVADSQGYDIAASAYYQPRDNTHVLSVSENIILPKSVLFHEFTHILDSEIYTNGDKNHHIGLFCFSEYHASQIELLQLLGAKKVDEAPAFSMNTIITTISGEKTVAKYVEEKHTHAVELFSRKDFPANIESLKSALGVLYNYFGLRSICGMYSTDYIEKINNNAFLKHIPSLYFCSLNNMMYGWLSKPEIEKSIALSLNITFSLIHSLKSI